MAEQTEHQAAASIPCEHHWASIHEPGHVLYWVRQCTLCHEVDWGDLDDEIGKLLAAERERIRQMAIRNNAVCAGDEGTNCYFADLLGPQERSGEKGPGSGH